MSTEEKNAAAGSGHHACASCKHQRKRCGPDCILAPYFPSARSRQFQAVHKVFGVSNVSKLIRSVRSHGERSRAAQSLAWEAEWRIKDPVSGCYGEYLRLRRELHLLCNAWSDPTSTAAAAVPNHHYLLNYRTTTTNDDDDDGCGAAGVPPALLHGEGGIDRYVMGRRAAGHRGASAFGLVDQRQTTDQLRFCGGMNMKTWRGGFQ